MGAAQPSQVERLMAVLQQRGVGVHLNCHELGEAVGVRAGDVAALLRHNVADGIVEVGGRSRRHTYAWTGKAMVEGRRMTCAACGENGRRKGAVLVAGLGYCCAPCGNDPQRMAAGRTKKAQAEKAALGRRGGNPYTEAKAPWRPVAPMRQPSEPAKPAEGHNVIRSTAPNWDTRYQLGPNERVIGGFATMGIGRYLEGGWA